MIRMTKEGTFTNCSVTTEKFVGKHRCNHIPGDEFIVTETNSKEDIVRNHRDQIIKYMRDETLNGKFYKRKIISEALSTMRGVNSRICMIEAATGVGKSAMIKSKMLDDMVDADYKLVGEGLVVIHTEEMKNEYLKKGMTEDFGFHYVTYDRLLQWKKARLLGKDYDLGFDLSKIKCISFDECHKACAEKWTLGVQEIIKDFNGKVYGFTATDTRTDNLKASDIFGEPVYYCPVEKAVEEHAYRNLPRYIVPEMDDSLKARMSKLVDEIVAQNSIPSSIKTKMLMKLAPYDKVDSTASKEKYFRDSIKQQMEENDGNTRIVVFCNDIADIAEKKKFYDKIVKEIDPHSDISAFTSESIDKNSDNALFRAFMDKHKDEQKHIKLIYTIEKFNTGFHMDELNIMVKEKTSRSEIKLKQTDGRMLGNREFRGDILDFSGQLLENKSADWEEIDAISRKSAHYGKNQVLFNNASKAHSDILEIERTLSKYNNKVLYGYNFIGPAEIAKNLGFRNNDPYIKQKRAFIKEYLKKGCTYQDLEDKRYLIDAYYGGPIPGIDFKEAI